MSALDGFYAAWNNARNTFGQGPPQGGGEYDGSGPLRQMESDLAAAAPGSTWSGAAASAYDAANSEHRQVFGKLADLDNRLAAYVDQSAEVVSAGRQNLDAVRRWVTDAVASVPPGEQRDTMLMQIASRGLGQLGDVIQKTNAESNHVARGLRGLAAEYDAVKNSQRFGGAREAPQFSFDKTDEGEEDKPYKTDMSSGNVEEIDKTNREQLAQLRVEYEHLADGQVKQDRLRDIAAIEEALTVPDSHLVYLEKPSDPSQMIGAGTSVGDPFKADSVSVSVPGVGSSTRDAIAGMTREAEQLRGEAAQVASETGESTNIATISWTGYQPPTDMLESSVLDDDLAQAGAPRLTSFLADLDGASQNPDQTVALFGHSYGSLTSGVALQEGASQYVDNVVMYGSPGFQATTPMDLGMRDDNFFVMAASDDPINYIADLAPLHGWGSSPNDVISENGDVRFRFNHLEVDAGDTPIADYESKTGASGHTEYPRDAQERMSGYNLAAILLDRPDLAVAETPRSW